MSSFAHFFSFYVTWVAVPCLAIIGIIFWIKQRTKESLVFASGIVLIAFGSLIQIFSPFARMTVDEAGKILSSSGPPLSWYTGSIIVSIGLIVTVVGFALVTWKTKRST
jgi:uncharacterized membrane protein